LTAGGLIIIIKSLSQESRSLKSKWVEVNEKDEVYQVEEREVAPHSL